MGRMASRRRLAGCSGAQRGTARQFERRRARSQAMSFRTKLLLIGLTTIFASLSVVAYGATQYTQAAFEEMDAERTEALVAQFNKEFAQRGEEIASQARNIAEATFTERMAIDLSRPNADLSIYFRDANGAAQGHGL